ncbi:MAG: dicarboxylate/amino acid:cation symporter [Pirellulaceae bacterium]|nr:dicarboxylate/amino acid:cation symporter [Pirellulaceae bacterium]
MTKKNKLALHWQILIGMIAGVLLGALAVFFDSTAEKAPEGELAVSKNGQLLIHLSKVVGATVVSIREKSPPAHGKISVDSTPIIGFDPFSGEVGFSPKAELTYLPTRGFVGSDSAIIEYKTSVDGEIENVKLELVVDSKQWNWSSLIIDWVKPFGVIFINLLKLIAIPLIVASLIKGISDLKDLSSLSSLGGRTVVLYLMTTVVSVTLGLVIVNLVQPGIGFSEETRAALTSDFEGDAVRRIDVADKQMNMGPLQALIDVVPDNIVGAATANGNMLKVIFFVIFFGVGLLLIDPTAAQPVKEFFRGLNEVILKMIDIIMKLAPLGVFSLLAAQVVATPSMDVLFGLLKYSVCVLTGLASMVFLFYPSLVVIFGSRTYRQFFNGISPAQLLAFSTSSSAATLPVTMECVEKNLGVKKEVASFVLPIGATVNMDGTSLYQAVAAVFIAQALGVELTMSDQLAIVLTATLASIGSAAVPGAGIVMLVIVLGSIGVSEKGIALIFAVDRILDMCRTTVNVTGDAAVAILVGRFQEKRAGVGDIEAPAS